MDRHRITSLLQATALFRGVPASLVAAVAEIVEERAAPPGQHVFFSGDVATEFFVLASGRVRVYVPGQGEELEVGVVQTGDVFGEGGMLDGGPRVGSAVALEAATVLAIPRARWLQLLQEFPELNRRTLVAIGASIRRYTSEAMDLLFLDVEIPDYPPDEEMSS